VPEGLKLPSFPPKFEEWQPGEPFKEPPLPRFILNPELTRAGQPYYGFWPGSFPFLLLLPAIERQ